MTTQEDTTGAETLPSRDELVTMVTRAHGNATYAESTAAGQALAAQSKMPKLVAQNLGAGFGQWDFFPEPAEIVDFALSYAAPANEEDVWALARRWATDDAKGAHTILALVGKDILMHELRRIEVPQLREIIEEKRASRAHALRSSAGLAVPAADAAPPGKAPKRERSAPAEAKGDAAPPRAARPPPPKREVGPDGVAKMPKPEFKKPPPKEAPPPAKRFTHPKFGEGLLEAQSGEGPEAKLTIKFEAGSKTLLAKFVTEVPS